MKKHLLSICAILFFALATTAQISPTSSPYYNNGNYSTMADSLTSASPNLLFYRPTTPGQYPVFMFQLGANALFSSAINRHSYDLYMQHLASFGIVVIVIDDSNAGMPSGNSFSSTFDWFSQNVVNPSHWLHNYADPNKVVIGGHSNGGVNACAFIDANPDAVQGIVLMASYPSPGFLGIGAHDVSTFNGKVLDLAGTEDDDSSPSACFDGYNAFSSTECKTWILVEGLDHGGFGDYVNSSQPVGSIGRENATASVRHFLVSWFLSEFKSDPVAAGNLSLIQLQPASVNEFDNSCGTITSITEATGNSMEIVCYPNPVQDVLTIEISGKAGETAVSVFDAIGNMVKTLNMNTSTSTTIDLSKYRPGIYYIQIKKNNENVTKMIIKS